MIQRIQTLYLLLVAVFMAVMASLPLGNFLVGDEEFILTGFGLYSVSEHNTLIVNSPYMGILMIMAAVLPFVTVFFYRHRLLQIRLCFMEMVLLVGVLAFLGYYIYLADKVFAEGSAISFSYTGVLPLVCLVLMWLAYKGIVGDEALVRSLDRIR